jgi:archaellum component FlaC
MTDVMVKIIVEVLDILATATKEMKQSRASEFILQPTSLEAHMMSSETFLKKVAGATKLEDGMKRLDRLTNEEVRMANAVVLKVTHNVDEKVTGVGDDVRVIDKKVQGVETQVHDVDGKVQSVAAQVEDVKGEVQVVNNSVKVVEEKVQVIIDGAKMEPG